MRSKCKISFTDFFNHKQEFQIFYLPLYPNRIIMKKKTLSSVAIALLMLAGCNSNSEPAKSTSSPSFDEVLTTRRSIRSYDATKKISEAEVRELLLATQEAPS